METSPSPDMVAGGMGVVACVFSAVIAVVALAALAFTIWMLIDAIKRVPSEGNTKLIWILVIIFTGVIGSAIYFFVQRPKNPPQA